MTEIDLLRQPGLRGSVEERFWANVDRRAPGECWPWKGGLGARGYGRIQTPWSSSAAAHRVSLMLAGVTIPEGHVADHICRNRTCVNPAHLRPATPRQNVLENSMAVTAINAAKTHCKHGHPFSPGNTQISKSNGQRVCLTCAHRASRASYERKLAAKTHLESNKS